MRPPRTRRWPLATNEQQLEGQKLRTARERLGLSQRDVAIAVGVSPATVGNVEAGIFSVRMKNRVAQALAELAADSRGRAL